MRLGMDKDEEEVFFFFAECGNEMNIVCMSEMGRGKKNEIVMYLTEFDSCKMKRKGIWVFFGWFELYHH